MSVSADTAGSETAKQIVPDDELQSKTISFLRFPLIVGVVFIHFNLVKMGLSAHGVNYCVSYPDWFYLLIRFFSEVLPSMAVPMFFLFSGYLFFYRTDFDGSIYKAKLRKRVNTLLIPFILWNVIGTLMIAMYKIPFLQAVLPGAANADIELSPMRILNIFYNKDNSILVQAAPPTRNTPYPIDAPLWFVREVMAAVILTPVIFQLIKKMGGWFVVLVGILWAVVVPIVLPGGYFSLLSRALFFFSWGAYYGINKLNFVAELRKWKFAPFAYLPFLIADTLTKGLAINPYLRDVVILLGIITVVIVAVRLLESGKARVNPLFVKPVFFIFALHGLIMQNIGKMMVSVLHLPDNALVMTAFYFAVPIVTIAACMGIYMLINKYLPTICRLLTGNR
ncbi:MAG: acyltransferase family protein [Salinivirgaceae bacterium]|nr:acyltransferase family protein [Salinivirgaceae bacterium]